jgi:hypothetical protein
MPTLKDPSIFTRPMLHINRDSKTLARLYNERESRKDMSWPEAKVLVCDELKRMKEESSTIGPNAGFSRVVADAHIAILNKYLPKIQKSAPEDATQIKYELSQDIKNDTSGPALLPEKMKVFYVIDGAINDLSKFSGV